MLLSAPKLCGMAVVKPPVTSTFQSMALYPCSRSLAENSAAEAVANPVADTDTVPVEVGVSKTSDNAQETDNRQETEDNEVRESIAPYLVRSAVSLSAESDGRDVSEKGSSIVG